MGGHPRRRLHRPGSGRADPPKRGDYLMAVKGNQPWLWWEGTTLFSDVALIRESGTTAVTVDKGHGRLERRQVWTSSALAGCSTWPHLAQAVCLEREVVVL